MLAPVFSWAIADAFKLFFSFLVKGKLHPISPMTPDEILFYGLKKSSSIILESILTL